MTVGRCDAEIADRKTMKTLPKGRLAWKGCRKPAVWEVFTRRGSHLEYCQAHFGHIKDLELPLNEIPRKIHKEAKASPKPDRDDGRPFKTAEDAGASRSED